MSDIKRGSFVPAPYLFLQKPRFEQTPALGGEGQSASFEHFVEQNATCLPVKQTPLAQSASCAHVAPNAAPPPSPVSALDALTAGGSPSGPLPFREQAAPLTATATSAASAAARITSA